jgi:putative transposase
MLKGIQVKLYPSVKQLALIKQHADASRWVYNECIARGKDSYEKSGLSLGKYTLTKAIAKLKNTSEDHSWLKLVHSQVLQDAVFKYDKAMSNFFRRIKQGKVPGYPRFKSRYNSTHSFSFPQQVRVNENNTKIKLPKIGWVRFRGGQRLTDSMTIKSATVRYHTSGLVLVSILVDDKNHASANVGTSTVGLDVGVRKFIADSDGNMVASLDYSDKLQLIADLNRKLAKAVKGSNNRSKIKHKLSKTYSQLANRRKDYCHRVANLYTGYRIVYVEDLTIPDMIENTSGTIDRPNYSSKQKTNLNASIVRQAWGQLFSILGYKLTERKSMLVKVDPRYTSQTCSACGNVDKRSREGEQYACVSCGHTEDADTNAAKNIKQRGIGKIELVPA